MHHLFPARLCTRYVPYGRLKMFTIDTCLLNTIMKCRGCRHEMLAIDVMVAGDDICCPICFDVVDVQKDEHNPLN